MNPRAAARALAKDAIQRNEPLAWFEELYRLAKTTDVVVPWADRCPNPNLIDLVQRIQPLPVGLRSLKVGCGLGDDAEWMSELGWETTAFDIAPSAITECHRRFPQSRVAYHVADLFHPPAQWHHGFDVVQESYTLQVLPIELRQAAIAAIASFVRVGGGLLLLIARGRDADEPAGEMPWPLTEEEVRSFEDEGLQLLHFRDYRDAETLPVRRFQLCFRRP